MDRELALVLSIDENVYSVVPVPAVGKVYQLEKQGDAGVTVYDVVVTPFGPECTCPWFTWKYDGSKPHGCKHLEAMNHFGML